MRLFLMCLILVPGLLPAQFSGPNAVTYNAAKDKYFVSNLTGKNVIAMDRSGNKSVFISGLKAPNNVLFAKLPLGEGYLVLDSNEVALYDSAGNYYVSQTISGARKLQDIVVDEDSAILYVSDVDRGVIYKTTFGPAPFFFPSTVIFVQNLRRPAGMLFQKKQNRVLFGLDTAGSDLYAFDLKTGTVSTIKTLGMNRIIGLGEDAQGNLYISSPGEKYIYQLNKYLSGTPRKLFGEPRPGDLYINPPKNEWVFTCVLCGTVNIAPIHDFGPLADMAGCRGDSVISYRNGMQKNFGSFDAGNEFIVELSDTLGKFGNPTELGRKSDTILPNEIHCKLPEKIMGSNKYLQRWRSTKPARNGSFAQMEIYRGPLAYLYGSPTVDACIGTNLILGQNNPYDPDISYSWYPPGKVDSFDTPRVKHVVQDTQRIYLQAFDSNTGCHAIDSVLVLPISKPDLGPWNDTLNVCSNDSILLGKPAKGGLEYAWSPSAGLNDSNLARPRFKGISDANYSLKVSGAGGCFSTYTQYIRVHAAPLFNLFSDSVALCFGDSFTNQILPKGAGNYDFFWWTNPFQFYTGAGHTVHYPLFNLNYRVQLIDQATGCSSDRIFRVVSLPKSAPGIVKRNDTTLQLDGLGFGNIRWYRNDTLLPDKGDSIHVKMNGIYRSCAVNEAGCNGCSDDFKFNYSTGANYAAGLRQNCRAYPNPAVDILYLDCARETSVWSLMDLSGRVLRRGLGAAVELKGLAPGNYSMHCEGNAIRVMVH